VGGKYLAQAPAPCELKLAIPLLITAVAVYNINCSKVLIREWTYKVMTPKRALRFLLLRLVQTPRRCPGSRLISPASASDTKRLTLRSLRRVP
jgi:hypothetical protein